MLGQTGIEEDTLCAGYAIDQQEPNICCLPYGTAETQMLPCSRGAHYL